MQHSLEQQQAAVWQEANACIAAMQEQVIALLHMHVNNARVRERTSMTPDRAACHCAAPLAPNLSDVAPLCVGGKGGRDGGA